MPLAIARRREPPHPRKEGVSLSVPRGVSRQAWKRLRPFQQAVYRATCRIPRGQTRSYQWVAQAIGRPKAARAVGRALRDNPFAPTVPCHRVIRSTGALGGFVRGEAAKRRLLAAEGVPTRPRHRPAPGGSRKGHEVYLAVDVRDESRIFERYVESARPCVSLVARSRSVI